MERPARRILVEAAFERRGKRRTVVATAIARELAAFIWAINREVAQNRQA